jgi:hypothetical protein
MPSNFIPSREADLLSWSNNLATKLIAAPTDYGIDAAAATAFGGVQGAFASAYATAIDPDTRTPSAIAIKNTAKKNLIAAVRPLVQTLQASPVMTDGKRELLQIPIRDNDPTPIGPPEVMPVLRVAAVNGRVLDLELRRQDGETKQKPAGVRAAWLYSFVGDTPPVDLNDWHFRGGTTKSNPKLDFPITATPGTVVWVTALWVNPTDQPGPACAPVNARISYQGLSEAA